eukprot:6175834-Pleurochrysis_carterae.AAC.2
MQSSYQLQNTLCRISVKVNGTASWLCLRLSTRTRAIAAYMVPCRGFKCGHRGCKKPTSQTSTKRPLEHQYGEVHCYSCLAVLGVTSGSDVRFAALLSRSLRSVRCSVPAAAVAHGKLAHAHDAAWTDDDLETSVGLGDCACLGKLSSCARAVQERCAHEKLSLKL